MAFRTRQWQRALRHLAVSLIVGCVGVVGCGKSQSPTAPNPVDNNPRAVSSDNHDAPANSADAADDAFHHPFAKAVRQLDDAPAGCSVPPTTVSGKSVYKIYKDVASQWDTIRFTTADGKRIHYTATIVTAFGEIDIELRPDLAPNHVRSFVALARAGYYDQLFFDHINHEEYPGTPGVRNDFLEAGSPTGGAGDDDFGSVGYWLYPETKPAELATHLEGTVGACRGIEKDSAGCKFYISLSKAPFNDTHYTIFGQVTRGLDVARRIFDQPIAAEERGHYGLLKPERPVMIQKVLIHTEGNGAEGKN
jgi:peptidyl-prolyl cis-trans isomerase B (cyclophilin B)